MWTGELEPAGNQRIYFSFFHFSCSEFSQISQCRLSPTFVYSLPALLFPLKSFSYTSIVCDIEFQKSAFPLDFEHMPPSTILLPTVVTLLHSSRNLILLPRIRYIWFVYLYRIHTWKETWDSYFLTQQCLVAPVFFQMASLRSYLWLRKIPLCVCISFLYPFLCCWTPVLIP